MISRSTFYRRVAQNRKQLKKDRKNGQRHFTAHGYVFADGTPFDLVTETHCADDFVAAVMINALPYRTSNGVDAVMMINGVLTDVELKSRTIKTHKVWCGPRGGIYAAGTGRTASAKTPLNSAIQASYEIYTDECRQSKYIPTIMVCIDSTTGQCIDAFILTGDAIKEAFDAKEARGSKVNGNVFIKLSTFLHKGLSMSTAVPKIGYDKYKEIIVEHCDRGVWGPSDNFDRRGYAEAAIEACYSSSP